MKDIYIVEGQHDAMRLKRLFSDITLLITGGSNIAPSIFEELDQLKQQGYRFILCLDPDSAGYRIRNRLEAYLGPCAHIHLQKEDCQDHHREKIGIEHASDKVLIEAFKYIHQPKVSRETLTKEAYRSYCVLPLNARQNRAIIARHFHLPMGNAKAFFHTLNRHHITLDQIKEAVNDAT